MIKVVNNDHTTVYYTIQDLFLDEEERFEIHIEDYNLFYKNKEMLKNAEKHNFYGKYILTLEDNGEISTYECIYIEQYVDPWSDTIFKLLPVKFSDEKIFQYVDTNRFSFPEDTNLKLTLEYIPFTEILKNIKEDELLTFAGETEKINDTHHYIHNPEYDTNFQITDEPINIGIVNYPFEDLCDVDIENMKNDNYMGKIKIVYVNSIGMPLISQFNIIETNEEGIICEPSDLPTPDPSVLLEVAHDKHMIPVKSSTMTLFDYIPYQNVHDDVCE